MKESGVIRTVVVATLLVVLAELFVQARNYAWLWDFFGDESALPSTGEPPYDLAVVRGLWVVATALLIVTVTLVATRRWIAVGAFAAFAASIWLTPSKFVLPGQDGDTYVFGLAGESDTTYQVALALVALAAAALVALLLLPRRT